MVGALLYILLAVWLYSTFVDKNCGGNLIRIYLFIVLIGCKIGNTIVSILLF